MTNRGIIIKEWLYENVISLIFITFSLIVVGGFIWGFSLVINEEELFLQGDRKVGIIIIDENKFRLEGEGLFKTAVKKINLNKYEHIIVDGMDYFIMRK
jgi:predicted acetyltransferase